MAKLEARQLNYVFSKKYSLTENVINGVKKSIKDNYGLDVARVNETEKGYVFISNHGYTIGDLTYNPHTGLYNKFNFHEGVIEKEIEASKHGQKKIGYRKFKLQRNKMIVRLTAASIATFIVLGVIKAMPKNTINDSQIVVVETHLNNLETADDIVLVSWANYAMDKITDLANKSPYDYIKEQRKNLYADFVNAMNSYYNYVDQVESLLPVDLTKPLTDKYHEAFRSAIVTYNNAVKGSLFLDFAFDSTPYVDAALLSKDGQIFTDGRYTGEVVDSDKKVVLLDFGDRNYQVYVQASDVTNVSFDPNTKVDQSIMYNGRLYVSDNYLN